MKHCWEAQDSQFQLWWLLVIKFITVIISFPPVSSISWGSSIQALGFGVFGVCGGVSQVTDSGLVEED